MKDDSMNTASFYLQVDPDLNHHFRRRWSEPKWTAAEIDRIADHLVSVGNHRRAEELSHLAQSMRDVAR